MIRRGRGSVSVIPLFCFRNSAFMFIAAISGRLKMFCKKTRKKNLKSLKKRLTYKMAYVIICKLTLRSTLCFLPNGSSAERP